MTTENDRLEVTAEMLGTMLGVGRDPAYDLIQFGMQLGWVTKIGNMPPKGGRGRGRILYAVPKDLDVRLTKLWSARKEAA